MSDWRSMPAGLFAIGAMQGQQKLAMSIDDPMTLSVHLRDYSEAQRRHAASLRQRARQLMERSTETRR